MLESFKQAVLEIRRSWTHPKVIRPCPIEQWEQGLLSVYA